MNFLDLINSIDKNRLVATSSQKIQTSNILIDQSNQNISQENFKKFQKFTDENNVVDRFQKVLEVEICNLS